MENAAGTKRRDILTSSHLGAIRPPVGHVARRPLGEAHLALWTGSVE